MKKSLALALLLASSCVSADPYQWFTGLANDMVDEPIDTYAKEIVLVLEDVPTELRNEYMFDLDVRHRAASNNLIGETDYHCTTVTLEDDREYRMAIKKVDGEYAAVLEGNLSYMALCSPHTDQGKIEIEMILFKQRTQVLIEEGTKELKKHIDTYL